METNSEQSNLTKISWLEGGCTHPFTKAVCCWCGGGGCIVNEHNLVDISTTLDSHWMSHGDLVQASFTCTMLIMPATLTGWDLEKEAEESEACIVVQHVIFFKINKVCTSLHRLNTHTCGFPSNPPTHLKPTPAPVKTHSSVPMKYPSLNAHQTAVTNKKYKSYRKIGLKGDIVAPIPTEKSWYIKKSCSGQAYVQCG
jgi:hypothetical protein